MSYCILWPGYILPTGYGQRSYQGKPIGAHRVAWMEMHGPIPKGLVIDHLCRNRSCVNVEHLRLITHAENCAQRKSRVTHCPYGHPYSGDNLVIVLRTGYRKCRTCQEEYRRWYYRDVQRSGRAVASGRGGGQRHKTRCPAGHPYSGTNLMMTKAGHRKCRECANARRRSSGGAETTRAV